MSPTRVPGPQSPRSHDFPYLRRRDRDHQSYLELTKLIPAFKDVIANPNNESRAFYYAQVSQLYSIWHDFTDLSSIRAQLHDGANNARSDDISRMKWAVANFLNKRLNGPPDPPLDINTRDGRGLQNNFTGRLLCPIKYDWEDPVWVLLHFGCSTDLRFFSLVFGPKSVMALTDTVHLTTTGSGACMKGRMATLKTLRQDSSKAPSL